MCEIKAYLTIIPWTWLKKKIKSFYYSFLMCLEMAGARDIQDSFVPDLQYVCGVHLAITLWKQCFCKANQVDDALAKYGLSIDNSRIFDVASAAFFRGF